MCANVPLPPAPLVCLKLTSHICYIYEIKFIKSSFSVVDLQKLILNSLIKSDEHINNWKIVPQTSLTPHWALPYKWTSFIWRVIIKKGTNKRVFDRILGRTTCSNIRLFIFNSPGSFTGHFWNNFLSNLRFLIAHLH